MSEQSEVNLSLQRDGTSTVSAPGAADARRSSLSGIGGFDVDKRMASMGKELRPLNLKSREVEENK